ncbi:hypothetical protein ACA350_02475 [Orientia tsutsugamushi]|uniref:hypothetical protein n=1 Tax=Orientia tsutsugamushi TaxID=784 RepID=UPI0012D3C66E
MRNLILQLRLKVIMQNQKLCWALSRPLKYMGLSIVFWFTILLLIYLLTLYIEFYYFYS